MVSFSFLATQYFSHTHTHHNTLVFSIISFTSYGYRQGLAFSGDECASTQLDPIQAVVVALVGALGVGEGEGDGRGEGGQGLAHCAVGTDQTQLEGTSRVLLRGGAGDVKTVAFNDGTSRGLRGRVIPVLGSQEFHCDQMKNKKKKKEFSRLFKVIQSKQRKEELLSLQSL